MIVEVGASGVLVGAGILAVMSAITQKGRLRAYGIFGGTTCFVLAAGLVANMFQSKTCTNVMDASGSSIYFGQGTKVTITVDPSTPVSKGSEAQKLATTGTATAASR